MDMMNCRLHETYRGYKPVGDQEFRVKTSISNGYVRLLIQIPWRRIHF